MFNLVRTHGQFGRCAPVQQPRSVARPPPSLPRLILTYGPVPMIRKKGRERSLSHKKVGALRGAAEGKETGRTRTVRKKREGEGWRAKARKVPPHTYVDHALHAWSAVASRQRKKVGRREVDKTAPPTASPWPCPGLTCLDRPRLAETADRTSRVAPFGILAGRKR